MVKPLTFKGDKKVKKRKHKEGDTTSAFSSLHKDENAADADAEETWTTADTPSDLAGPIMVLLPQTTTTSIQDPSPKHSCLASDASGTIFASNVENFIPETPLHLSAEPSDVRQVWVVNRIPGENSGWTLKSHTGKYLSADQFGVLTADREAAGAQEVFFFVAVGEGEREGGKTESGGEDRDKERHTSDGAFYIRTSRETYIAASWSHFSSSSRNAQGNGSLGQPMIRADTETRSSNSTVFVRMQSRFKPRLKATRELKAKEKVSRKQLEEAVGRRLDEDEVRRLKRARRDGGWHEAVLDARVKGSHDKFA